MCAPLMRYILGVFGTGMAVLTPICTNHYYGAAYSLVEISSEPLWLMLEQAAYRAFKMIANVLNIM